MLNKRGQGLSVNAIILIVLGIAVLAFLILGFAMGWQKILPFIGGDTVDSVVDSCNTACLAGQQYNFCARGMTLKVDGKLIAENVSCYTLATEPQYVQYGIKDCKDNPVVTCTAIVPEAESSESSSTTGNVVLGTGEVVAIK